MNLRSIIFKDRSSIEFQKKMSEKPKEPLKEGEDYYINEDALLVFTRNYHLKRGFCCKNGCKHCPYGFKTLKKEF